MIKKLLGIVVLGLLLSGCVYHDAKVFKNLDRDKGDVRINLVEGDKELIYVGLWVGEADYDVEQKGIDLGWFTDGYKDEVRRVQPMALKACKINFKLNDATKLKSWLTTKEEAIKYKLGLKVYDIYKCKKSSEQIYLEREEEKKIEREKKIELEKSKSTSTNTLNRSFVCSYGGEKSRIKIRGNTASEITAIGVTINYSIVDMSDKGAFTLTGSSKMGRAWFIGAKSFLFLGASPIPYDCN
jgi:hypothetical protein